MDENYLDNLLNEFSLDKEIDHKIEDELDEEITSEKRRRKKANSVSREESFNLDLEQDANALENDIDLTFSEEQIDELDRLDNLADIDIGDMDFSDIDFDDIDITKLGDELSDNFDDLLNDFEGDLEIPDFSMHDDVEEDSDIEFQESDSEESLDDSESNPLSYEEDESSDEQAYDNNSGDDSEGLNDEASISEGDNAADYQNESGMDNLNVDSFDADSFLDSLLEESNNGESNNGESNNQESNKQESNNGDDNNESANDSLDSLLDDDLQLQNSSQPSDSDEIQPLSDDDDLFSMLNLDDQASGDASALNDEGSGLENLTDSLTEVSQSASELEIENSKASSDEDDSGKKPKKKRSFMEILFGEPDEDDIETEEEIQAREAKKAEKKAKKEAAKAAKADKAEKAKAKKSLDDAKKKKDDAEKKRIKAEKKAKKKAEEAANAEPEKKLNKPMVIFIFSVFLGGVGFFYLSTVDFNYKLAIKQAADYFASQKYHKAYDEIKGVEVKEKDKELKERIYTVMYVERLYESYENNLQMGRQKKALDSLLRGVTKYYEYYDEAKELDIVSDLDYSFSQIKDALQNNYGITIEEALSINDLDDYEYLKTIEEYTEGMTED